MQLVKTNPRILLWPGSTVLFSIVEPDGRIRTVSPFSVALFKLLKKLLVPVDLRILNEILCKEKLEHEEEYLLKTGLLINIEHVDQFESWHGFRITDTSKEFTPINGCEPTAQVRYVLDEPIFIVDDLLDEKCRSSVTSWFSCQSYSLIDIDSDKTAFSKHWVRVLDVTPVSLLSIPIFSWLDATTRYYCDSVKLKLAEAKAYVTPYGDTPTYHRDSEVGETITTILYCHPNWEIDWGGELIISDQTGDPQLAIFPKPGRLVIFRGDFPHKAGAPSRLAFSPRLAIVLRYEVQ